MNSSDTSMNEPKASAFGSCNGSNRDASGIMTYAVSNQHIQEITVAKKAATAPAATDKSPVEEKSAFAAMQEAATILMEADQQKKRKAEKGDSQKPANTKKPRSLSTRVPWESRLTQLAEYKKEHGNLLIPIRYKKNPSLGKFVHNTREQYKLYHKQTPEGFKKKCSLTKDRIKQLQELDFVFSTERTKRQNEDWVARLKQLEQFKETNGHLMVPHGYVADPSFSEWVHRQRVTYQSHNKTKTPNKLVEERIQKLKSLGFNFAVHDDKWMNLWKELKEYKRKHGDCQVPTHYNENPKLGRWVHTQRHQNRLRIKGKKSGITQERFDLLNTLGFSWVVRPSLERPRASWTQRFEEAENYKRAHGHFKIDPLENPDLAKFCQDQRYRLRLLEKNGGHDVTNRMKQERVDALHRIGFTRDTELLERPDNTSHAETVPTAIAKTGTENSVAAATQVAVEDDCPSSSSAAGVVGNVTTENNVAGATQVAVEDGSTAAGAAAVAAGDVNKGEEATEPYSQ